MISHIYIVVFSYSSPVVLDAVGSDLGSWEVKSLWREMSICYGGRVSSGGNGRIKMAAAIEVNKDFWHFERRFCEFGNVSCYN